MQISGKGSDLILRKVQWKFRKQKYYRHVCKKDRFELLGQSQNEGWQQPEMKIFFI